MLNKLISHDILYLIALCLIAIGLPLSEALISIGIVAIGINWILEGKFKTKYNLFINNKSLWIFLSIYAVHVLWLIGTENWSHALKDLRIKLPLLVLPLVMGTSLPLNKKKIHFLILLFSASVLVGSLVSTYVLLGFSGKEIFDPREISIFISHIRFSLLINISIFFQGYFIYKKDFIFNREKYFHFFSLVWLVFFLFILNSLTGIIIFLIILFFGLGFMAYKSKKRINRFLYIGSVLTFLFLFTFYFLQVMHTFSKVEKKDKKSIPEFTKLGNKYFHDFENEQVENNDYVWLYVCEKELQEGWNQVSNLPYDGKDKKGHQLRFTLIRYLTSKGLKKDAEGIGQLTSKDIHLIEEGYANHIYKNKFKLYPKLYETYWQIQVYKNGGNPSGHSVTLRFEYLKAGFNIVKNNFWFGVGTGDVQQSFDNFYDRVNSPLSEKWRRRTHNQFITFLISFGIFGFSWIIFALFYPCIKINYDNYFSTIFIIIALLSMLNEDTLETHTGISFFAFFYALLMFGRENKFHTIDATKT